MLKEFENQTTLQLDDDVLHIISGHGWFSIITDSTKEYSVLLEEDKSVKDSKDWVMQIHFDSKLARFFVTLPYESGIEFVDFLKSLELEWKEFNDLECVTEAAMAMHHLSWSPWCSNAHRESVNYLKKQGVPEREAKIIIKKFISVIESKPGTGSPK